MYVPFHDKEAIGLQLHVTCLNVTFLYIKNFDGDCNAQSDTWYQGAKSHSGQSIVLYIIRDCLNAISTSS